MIMTTLEMRSLYKEGDAYFLAGYLYRKNILTGALAQ